MRVTIKRINVLQKGAGGGATKAATKTSPKAPAKRKSGGAKGGKKTAKKSKKDDSDEDDDEDVEDEEDEEMDDEDEEEEDGAGDGKSKKTVMLFKNRKILFFSLGIDGLIFQNSTATKPNRKAGANHIKSFPDKDGKFELYLFKNDLAKDFRNDPKLCMWRRDGSSLLQKYIMTKDEDNKDDVFFTASSVVRYINENAITALTNFFSSYFLNPFIVFLLGRKT